MATNETRTYNIAKETSTDKPSGLSITRNGEKFTFKWKIGDKNYGGGQLLQWRVNGGEWNNKHISTTTTSATTELDFGVYYPTTKTKLNSIEFRVRGMRESWTKTVTKKKKSGSKTITKIYNYVYFPKFSAWESKKYSTKIPDDPKITASSQTGDNVNRTTFTVTEAAPADKGNVSRRVVWESVLVSDCNYTDGKKATWKSNAQGWQTGTMAANGGSKAIDESALGNGSYTRFFRAMAKGVHGDSKKWNYSSHVYAQPNTAIIKSASADIDNGTYDVTVEWTADATTARPIDDVTIQYVIGTPETGGTAPTDNWQDAVTLKDTEKRDGTTFDVPDVCGEDQALFVRVNTNHDNRTAYGAARRVAVGYINPPTNFSVSVTDRTATITADNGSAIQDSYVEVWAMYRKYGTSGPTQIISVTTLLHGTTTKTATLPSAIPTGAPITFVAQTKTSYMSSQGVTYGTSIPAAPTGLALAATSTPGTIRASWNWSWSAANRAELSWADHSDAWESTDQPAAFEIDHKATQWYISSVETGVSWYVRVRLGLTDGDDTTWSAWSEPKDIRLASAPVVPVLTLSAGIITSRGTVDASWVYVTSDGTGQGSAILAEVTYSGTTPTYRTIASTTTAQTLTISASKQGWTTGTTHLLAVRVKSGSGKLSDDWSAPVPITIANAVTCTITQTSLETVTETIEGATETYTALTEMPLTLTVTGARAGGITSVTIEREDEYFLNRPDESISRGYAGETIAVYSQQGEAQISISNADLIGHLDDGASYVIIATTQDSYGQTATAEQSFRVKWTDQAVLPEASATMDEEYDATIITPTLPAEIPATSDTAKAVADIYRLSVDKPVLIYEGATFGESYVDPYPTIGEYGGHRIVYRSKNGDYITPDNAFAWVDIDEADGDYLESEDNIIEWPEGRVLLRHNIELANSWSKDFTETQYLGGSVQGDWNPAVSRSGSLSAVGVTTDDQTLIQGMRRLATYPGMCHVRTKDGSNYWADVQVSEKYSQGTAHKLVEFDVKITRVDEQQLDGLTLAEWREMHPLEGE